MLHSAYRCNRDLVPYEIHRRLTDLFPSSTVLATDDCAFDLRGFTEDGHCIQWVHQDLEPLLLANWRGRDKGTSLDPAFAFSEILWNGQTLKCLKVLNDYDDYVFLISEDRNLCRRFFEAVCAWSGDAAGRVIVFDIRFRRDPALEEGIKAASWDALVLPEDTKARLYQDVVSFFSAKESYARYGLAWKRGVLLYGPPGNGKTHAIKALVKETGRPCIVVRSLKEHEHAMEGAVGKVFRRARQTAPSILLFEDIDSIVSRNNLSAVLNEIDGLACNDGLLCLATTNYLAKLDPALANRPSRFDRKYEFGNPRSPERLRFLKARFEAFDPAMRPSDEALRKAAVECKRFSGAMLQELVSSCAMSWMRVGEGAAMDSVLEAEVRSLRPQRADE